MPLGFFAPGLEKHVSECKQGCLTLWHCGIKRQIDSNIPRLNVGVVWVSSSIIFTSLIVCLPFGRTPMTWSWTCPVETIASRLWRYRLQSTPTLNSPSSGVVPTPVFAHLSAPEPCEGPSGQSEGIPGLCLFRVFESALLSPLPPPPFSSPWCSGTRLASWQSGSRAGTNANRRWRCCPSWRGCPAHRPASCTSAWSTGWQTARRSKYWKRRPTMQVSVFFNFIIVVFKSFIDNFRVCRFSGWQWSRDAAAKFIKSVCLHLKIVESIYHSSRLSGQIVVVNSHRMGWSCKRMLLYLKLLLLTVKQ